MRWERSRRRKGTTNKDTLSVAAKVPLAEPAPLCALANTIVPFAPRALSLGSAFRGCLITCCLLFLDGSCPLSADASVSPALGPSSGEARPNTHTMQMPQLVTLSPPWIFSPQHAPRL